MSEQTETMHGITLSKYGDNSVLTYSENLPIPKITKPDEVLIKIFSAAINPHDFKLRSGEAQLVFSYELPIILGYDLSGEIVEVGEYVSKFTKGDKVYSVGQTGAFANYIVVPEFGISLKPSNLTHDEAASLPMVGLTTIQAFSEFKPEKDSKIFISGGAGGIGTFAIQYASNILKCEVATTTSEKKIELCKSLGATTVIDYHKEDFSKILSNYDFAYDTTNEVEKCFKILKSKGIARSIASIPDGGIIYQLQDLGLKGQSVFSTTILDVLSSKTRFVGWMSDVNYKSILMVPSGEQLSELAKWVEDGKIKPVIDKVFTLKNIADAYTYLETGRATGKVVIHIIDE
jgi:alcohol dehydrogenase